MNVTLRRRITRICIAVDVLLLIAAVIGDSLGRSRSWGAGGIAFAVAGIVAGLLYLRSTRGRP